MAPVVAPQVIKAPASKPVAAQPPRVVRRVPVTTQAPAGIAPRTVRVPAYEACASGQTTRRVGNQTVTMRCGPQTTPHVTPGAQRGAAPAGGGIYYPRGAYQKGYASPTQRIVPRHVYEQRDTQQAHIPAGYRPAWDDDRLNPHRASQTVDGHLATQQVWTNQVPRQLVVKPQRVPFPQNVWTPKYKHEIKPPKIAYHATDPYPAPSVAAAHAASMISTRTSEPTGKAGWVEIGVFTTPSKAQAAAQRLLAAGLPAQLSAGKHKGQSVHRLRVGPYGTPAALKAALSVVHGTGYTQAYLR